MDKDIICGFIFTETRLSKEAEKFAEKIKYCPYLIVLAVSSNKIYSAYIVPEKKRWWLEYPQLEPKKLGLKNAEVYICEKIIFPGKFIFKTPQTKSKINPCGANCSICGLRYKYKCDGCPAYT